MELKEKIQRVKWQGDLQLCYCSNEQIYKPCSQFNPRNQDHGFQYYCKECIAFTKSREYKPRHPPSVYLASQELLQKLGYVLNSDISVHQQFLNKYFNDRV